MCLRNHAHVLCAKTKLCYLLLLLIVDGCSECVYCFADVVCVGYSVLLLSDTAMEYVCTAQEGGCSGLVEIESHQLFGSESASDWVICDGTSR
jgi:hypothetical protein